MSAGLGTRTTQRKMAGASVNRRRAQSRSNTRDKGKVKIGPGATLSFTAPDKINDSGNGFTAAAYQVGFPVEVLGSPLNKGEWVIAATSTGQLTVLPALIQTEANLAQVVVEVEDFN
jgi:hypothetical protein